MPYYFKESQWDNFKKKPYKCISCNKLLFKTDLDKKKSRNSIKRQKKDIEIKETLKSSNIGIKNKELSSYSKIIKNQINHHHMQKLLNYQMNF